MVITEVQSMLKLHHINLVNIIEYGDAGVVKRPNGDSQTVVFIVLELAVGGELFDFVA
jgi:serine/threonine protein kinase